MKKIDKYKNKIHKQYIMKQHAIYFSQNDINPIYKYVKENIDDPLIFFKEKDLDYAIELIKYLYPTKCNNINIERKEYVKLTLENFPHIGKNMFNKKSYVSHNNEKYFLQITNGVLTEFYFIVTLS